MKCKQRNKVNKSNVFLYEILTMKKEKKILEIKKRLTHIKKVWVSGIVEEGI